MAQLSFHSPVGELTISEQDGKIVSMDWGWSPFSKETDLLVSVRGLLEDYFDGNNPAFDVSLDLMGTPYQKKIWAVLRQIPYGETWTYAQAAEKANSHARPVGLACGRNPLPILIPCHRVMGKDGQLTGYSGGEGVETKQYLLDLEKATR